MPAAGRSKPSGRARTSANDWATRKAREAAREAHNGLCDLCGAAAGEKGLCGMTRRRGLDYDHDHDSGAHRGFICARANRQLWAWVTPEWLRRAADYLEARP